MRKHYFTSAALSALAAGVVVSGSALAQSTGTIAEEIVVTASKTPEGVQGVIIPDSPKARTVLTQEAISTQSSGQSILNIVNQVPSVNFTNNDPYGSSGGNIRIRSFDGNRISLTWDGVPLNDSGNYAIFSNQTLDPEIIEQVNVNQGTTDVDSPTASAAGGTVNYRTAIPDEHVGILGKASYGTFGFKRLIGRFDSGELTNFGTRFLVSASSSRNDKFKGPGRIAKDQYNFRLYQPLAGSDFLSVGAHFNRNRNNFYRNLTLQQAIVDLNDNHRYDYDTNGACTRPTFGPGAQSEAATSQASTAVPTNLTTLTGLDSSCTNFFGVRVNPSNTGNIRINSKFTLTDKLTLTVDPSFQYVLANGGGFATISETDARIRGSAGPAGPGKDLSGDGDTLDTVAFYTPNNTNTRRIGLLASVRYDLSSDHSFRLAYAYDRARHRQTGEWGRLDANGFPVDVFGGRTNTLAQVTSVDGALIRGRDRRSIAMLNQISAIYRGKFAEDKLTVELGLRSPWFTRHLNQMCFTQATNGTQICTTQPIGTTPAAGTTYVVPASFVVPVTGLVGTPVYAPYTATYKYHKILPNVGVTFRATDEVSFYASYAKGFSAPRTDNLYRAPVVNVEPETTNNFDIGVRYTSEMVQASLGAFLNKFQNRIVTSFDQAQGISVDRNIGKVDVKGIEASVDVRPFKWLSLRGYGSYLNGELKDNILLGSTSTGTPIIALTAGKKLVETPDWQFGYRAGFRFDPVSFGINYKHVSSRFSTDLNDQKTDEYDLYDLDARLSLKKFGYDKIFVQMNVHNLFNERYLGSISSQIATPTNISGQVSGLALGASIPGGANPTYAIGSPRAVSVSVQVGF